MTCNCIERCDVCDKIIKSHLYYAHYSDEKELMKICGNCNSIMLTIVVPDHIPQGQYLQYRMKRLEKIYATS